MEKLKPIHPGDEKVSNLIDDREQFGLFRISDTLSAEYQDDDSSTKLAWLMELMQELNQPRVDERMRSLSMKVNADLDREVHGLVQAMAGFEIGTAIESSFVNTYAAAIGDVIVANTL